MNTKSNKIIYWISTGLITLLMLFSAGMYIFNYEMVSETFIKLGYPTYIIYPLAIAKILGLIAIWFIRSNSLKEWAYAGFFFAMSGATISHFAVGQPITEALPSIILLLVTIASWYFRPNDRKIIELQKQN
mgnify:CR=1 FL=1